MPEVKKGRNRKLATYGKVYNTVVDKKPLLHPANRFFIIIGLSFILRNHEAGEFAMTIGTNDKDQLHKVSSVTDLFEHAPGG